MGGCGRFTLRPKACNPNRASCKIGGYDRLTENLITPNWASCLLEVLRFQALEIRHEEVDLKTALKRFTGSGVQGLRAEGFEI